MKKSTKTVKLSDIGWLPALNYRMQYGNTDGLRQSFLDNDGWLDSKPADAHSKDSELDDLKEYLTKQLGVLESAVENPQPGQKDVKFKDPADDSKTIVVEGHVWNSMLLKAFKEMHCNAKGNIIKPKYSGITGNRRSEALTEAVAIALYLEMDISNWTIPIVTPDRDYTNEERRDVQLFENNDTDRKKPTLLEEAKVALELVEQYGRTQNDLRKKFGASRGVQLYYLAVTSIFARREGWDDLDILFELLKGEDSKWDVKRFNQKALQGSGDESFMGPRCDVDYSFDKRNEQLLKKSEAPLERPTRDELAEWIEKVNEGENKRKCMSPQQIGGLTSSSNEVVRKLANAITRSDDSVMPGLNGIAEGCNFIAKATGKKYAVLVELFDLLKKLSEEQQIEYLQEIVEAAPDEVNEYLDGVIQEA